MKAFFGILCLFAAVSLYQHPLATGQTRRATPDYGKLPLGFEANQGQADPRVKFLSRSSGYNVFLTDDEAVLTLATPRDSSQERPVGAKTGVVRMKALGANRSAQISGVDALSTTTNYFVGSDPAKWHTNIASYAKVKYENVYRGVDLMYYGNWRELEYDFIVQPGARPSQIRLSLSLPAGLARPLPFSREEWRFGDFHRSRRGPLA